MTLADVAPSGSCLITGAAENNLEFQSRLYALGLYPGVRVDVLHQAPFGDPLQIRVGQTLLSIRKQEALSIEVEQLQVEDA